MLGEIKGGVGLGRTAKISPNTGTLESFVMETSTPNDGPRPPNDLGIMVSNCMLQQYWFTVGGTLLGMAVGSTMKKYTPLIIGIGLGQTADLIYGRYFACQDILTKYKNSSPK
jgi:hypothetical protein